MDILDFVPALGLNPSVMGDNYSEYGVLALVFMIQKLTDNALDDENGTLTVIPAYSRCNVKKSIKIKGPYALDIVNEQEDYSPKVSVKSLFMASLPASLR